MEYNFGDFVASIVALAFGAWAGVVAHLGNGIRQDIRNLSKALREQSDRLSSYILQTETRLALLEDRVNTTRRGGV